MAVLNPEHLFEQAENLVVPPPAGQPRQVNIRRAISAAYYGLFHAVLTAAANDVVGVTMQGTARYGLVYRSIDHKGLKSLCAEIQKATLSPKVARYQPVNGFGASMKKFAASVLYLQEKRHDADYDPMLRFTSSEAKLAIATARTAWQHFSDAQAGERKAFLALLLFEPR